MVRGCIEKYLPPERLSGAPTAVPTTYASGTLWPHGEWSFGYGKERPNGGDWHENPIDVSERAEAAICDGSAGQLLPLDLSDAANSHNSARRGLKGMSGYGQQMIKAGGHLLQERWPLHRKTLGTITLPEMSQAARAEVVALWSDLTRELLQWLTRRLKRQGLPPIVLSVTEIQPKRLTASGEGYLHWHLLWLNHPGRKGNWAIEPSDVRAWLDSVLSRKIPSYQGGFVNVDTRRVEGKVAAYLAKYMSKGKQMVAAAVEDWGEDNCPRTWWNMTAPARAMVKAAVRKGREVGSILEHNLSRGFETNAESHFEFLRKVEIEYDGHTYTAGWRGRFTPEVHRYVSWWADTMLSPDGAGVRCA